MRLARVADVVEGFDRERGVPDPGEAVVPVALARRRLGERGRRRRKERAGRIVRQGFERQRAAHDLVPVLPLVRAASGPLLPVSGRFVQVSLDDLLVELLGSREKEGLMRHGRVQLLSGRQRAPGAKVAVFDAQRRRAVDGYGGAAAAGERVLRRPFARLDERGKGYDGTVGEAGPALHLEADVALDALEDAHKLRMKSDVVRPEHTLDRGPVMACGGEKEGKAAR